MRGLGRRSRVAHFLFSEQPKRNLRPEAAQLLQDARVKAQEQGNAQGYRELSPAKKPSGVKKDR